MIDVQGRMQNVLTEFLDNKEHIAAHQNWPPEIASTLRGLLFAGGKRLRPALCVLGWQAAGAQDPSEATIRVAASLEMFHTFALIHDDVMDNTAIRRGHPTAHRVLAAHHPRHKYADRLGRHAAILLGDLALAWSDELLHVAGLPLDRLSAVHTLIATMRSELMYGQYLDITTTGYPSTDLERALAIIHHKTATYTIERPLQIGATLAGASAELLTSLGEFARPLGEGFQLRDDLLGVFGHPQETGKPILDDLRDGKHTVLVALALRAANASQSSLLYTGLGNPKLGEEDAAAIRAVITDTGAVRMVERMISDRHEQAVAALKATPLPTAVFRRLREIADQAVWRTA